MSIKRRPQPPKSEYEWVFIFWPRQIGDYRVAFEWLQRKVAHGGNHCEVTWKDKDDNILFVDSFTLEGW